MPATPVLSLIKTHGAVMDHHPLPSSASGKPWQPDGSNPLSFRIKGLLQKIEPVSHSDLPEGSMKAVAVLLIGANQPLPRPGDRLIIHAQQSKAQIWRVKTILPLVSTRRQRLVEAFVTSIGEGLDDHPFA